MKHKILLWVMVMGLVILPLVHSVNITYANLSFGDIDHFNLLEADWAAQTFTPTITFNVTKINLKVYNSNTIIHFNTSIKAVDINGKPTGTDLSFATNVSVIPTNSILWYNFTMPIYELQAGTKYAIVSRVTAVDIGGGQHYGRWRRNNPVASENLYLSGAGYYSADSGSTWNTYISPNLDFLFEIYGEEQPFGFDIISPLNQTYSINETIFNLTTTSTLTECQYSLDNWATNQTMAIYDNNNAYNITNLTAGFKYLHFWCVNTEDSSYQKDINFSVDLSFPKVNVSSLYEGKVYLYNYNISFNLTVADDNSDITYINITVDDIPVDYKKVNATGEWYYNLSFNTSILNLNSSGYLHTLKVILNDSLNHVTTTEYPFNLVAAYAYYTNPVYGGMNGIYNLSIPLTVNGYYPRLNSTAQFYYNRTKINYTRFSYEVDFGGTQTKQHRWDSSMVIPYVNETTTYPMYYDLYLYDRNYTGAYNYYNISLTQTVTDLNITTSCTNMSKAILNVTLYSEDEPASRLSGDFQMILNYSTVYGSGSLNISNFNLTNREAFQICADTGTQPIYLNMYILYNTTLGFTHRYYINNETVIAGTPRYLSLYNFNTTTDISELRITIRDSNNYGYLQDVYSRLERFYVGENVWRVVQMDKSDDFGFIDYNIREKTTDYRISFYDANNNLIKQSTTMKFACYSAVCELVFLLNPLLLTEVEPSLAFTSIYNNDTGMLNLTWVDNSNVITSLRTVVTKETGRTSTIICDTTQTGYSGYVSCNTSTYTGTIQLRSTSTSFESGLIITAIRYTQLFDASRLKLWQAEGFGVGEGAWWSFGIILTASMFGAIISVFVGIIALIFGSIIVFALGLMQGWTLALLFGVITLGLIIGIVLRSQR